MGQKHQDVLGLLGSEQTPSSRVRTYRRELLTSLEYRWSYEP